MTKRERFLIIAGLVIGLLIAGLILGVTRVLRPEASAAQTKRNDGVETDTADWDGIQFRENIYRARRTSTRSPPLRLKRPSPQQASR